MKKFFASAAGLFLLRILQGAVIGAAAILPGISGGVLSVVFGVYRPMMETLAHPRQNLKRHIRLLAAVGIGWALGFVVFAGVVGRFYQAQPNLCVCAMVGLVAGTFPSLFQEAGAKGHSRGSWLMFAAVVIFMSAFMRGFTGDGAGPELPPTVFWMFLCGVMWGFSFIVPGMTFSSVILWMGLFDDMTLGISDFRWAVLLPFAAGVVLVALLFSRLVTKLFETRYALAYHAVLGLAVASTVCILPTAYTGGMEALGCAGLFAAGAALALGMEAVMPKNGG